MKFKNGSSPTSVVESNNVPPLFTGKMDIGSIKKSERSQSEKIVLYAPEGWGKTTWASKSESPVFLSTEDGLKNVVVDKFPSPDGRLDIFAAIESLRTQDHKFKTLVIETADWTDHLGQSFLLARDNMKSIEDYGYGKVYVIAFEE